MPLKFFDAMHQTILMAVHQKNFKNGAFKLQIARSTSVLEATDILIASALLSSAEKKIIQDFRTVFVVLRTMYPNDDQEPPIRDIFPCFGAITALTEMLEADSRSRGEYVPPLMFQTMNDEGSIKETCVMAEDGTTRAVEGGELGVPPGAPEEFANAQRSRNANLWDEQTAAWIANPGTQVITGSRFRPELIPDTLEDAARMYAAGGDGNTGTASSATKSPETKEEDSH